MAGQQEIDIVIIVFGTMGMLVLALALVIFVVFYQKKRVNQQIVLANKENEYQRQLLKATIEERELQQQRIALELHDGVGSAITNIKMQLKKKDISETEIAGAVEKLKDLVGQIRNIAHDLLPPVLRELGLIKTLKNLCRKITEQTPLEVNFESPSLDFDGLNKEQELAIYRIVQELLNNILKHAKATTVNVSVVTTSDYFEVKIIDNGIGFVPPDKHDVESTSLGLKNIAGRVQQINATLTYEYHQPKGTLVKLTKQL